MKITILGANGQTGKLLVEQAINAGHTVHALVRNVNSIKPTEQIKVFVGDATNTEDIVKVSQGTEIIISTIGQGAGKTNLMTSAVTAIIEASKTTGVKRLILLSAAHAKREYLNWAVRLMIFVAKDTFADKRNSEEILMKSDMDWTIARPTMLLNKPIGFGLREYPIDTKIGIRHIVGRADVAEWMLNVAENILHLKSEVVLSK